MKFLNAVFPAALAGLLLLVPAVYAVPHFQCGVGNFITARMIEKCLKYSAKRRAEPDDPRGPNGEEYWSHRISATPEGGVETPYLVQEIDEYPFIQVYTRNAERWQPCVYMSN
ncbi:Bgt-50251 [Blumeria graminis f. sp. tritici]|uniref:Bgt-50251 n=1 Tax=Blumeria graminis f. sp. tritici TaxID=62690 RepID=A0A9X9MQ13_BLUGR|nr:Bgt-50251 [Blumeria graminis f. sp. tritici]